MLNESSRPGIPVSNWTLATGTRPGERHVYPEARWDGARWVAAADRALPANLV